MSAAPFAHWPGDDDPTPRAFRRGHSLYDEAVAVSAAVARDDLSPRDISALIEGAVRRGLPEHLAIEAVGTGLAAADTGSGEFPDDLKAQLDDLAAELGHSEIADHVLDEGFLTGCDALRQTPGVRSRWFATEVTRAMRRGLGLEEALAVVRAGFVEAAGR